jgi:hypothetical protein
LNGVDYVGVRAQSRTLNSPWDFYSSAVSLETGFDSWNDRGGACHSGCHPYSANLSSLDLFACLVLTGWIPDAVGEEGGSVVPPWNPGTRTSLGWTCDASWAQDTA